VVEPCKIQLHMTKKFDRSVLFENNIFIDIDACSAKMTTGDVLLITSILSRVAFVRNNEKMQISDENNEQISVGRRRHTQSKDNEFKSVIVINVMGTVGSLSFTTFDDTKGFVLPIFNLSIGTFDINASGTVESLNGSINLNAKIDHYNFSNGNWEPLLEPVSILFQVSKESNRLKFELNIQDEIQVNISMLMLKSILQTATRMRMNETKLRSITVKPLPHAAWIENHLGFDILIVSETETLELKGTNLEDLSIEPAHVFGCIKYRTYLPSKSFQSLDADTKLVELRSIDYKSLTALPVFVNQPLSFFLHTDKSEDTDPVKIIWDSTFEDGVRKIRVRSPIMFINQLDYPLALRVTLNSEEIVDLGVVKENGGIFYIPIVLCESILFFKAKPAHLSTGWSPNCMLADYIRKNSPYPMNFTCVDQISQYVYSAIVYSNVDPTSIKIYFSYNIHLINALPCLMRYRCVCDGDIITDAVLLPGRQKKMSHALASASTYIQISVGSLDWGPAIYSGVEENIVFELKECRADNWRCSQCLAENPKAPGDLLVCTECTFQRPRNPKYEEDTISLSYFTKVEKFATIVKVFSKYAFIDRSGIGIDVLYNSISTANLLRHTLREKNKSDGIIFKTIGMSVQDIPRIPEGKLAIIDTLFQSHRNYEVSIITEGSRVFTDRTLHWIHFPVKIY